MSLDFDVSNIKDYKELYPKTETGSWTKWHPRTEQIVFGCMATGIGRLTEGTVKEWYSRYTAWCKLHGFDRDLKLLPYKDVVQHIGLSTNVFPQETRAQWLKRIVGDTMDKYGRDAEYNRSHNNDTYNGKKKEKSNA